MGSFRKSAENVREFTVGRLDENRTLAFTLNNNSRHFAGVAIGGAHRVFRPGNALNIYLLKCQTSALHQPFGTRAIRTPTRRVGCYPDRQPLAFLSLTFNAGPVPGWHGSGASSPSRLIPAVAAGSLPLYAAVHHARRSTVSGC